MPRRSLTVLVFRWLARNPHGCNAGALLMPQRERSRFGLIRKYLSESQYLQRAAASLTNHIWEIEELVALID